MPIIDMENKSKSLFVVCVLNICIFSFLGGCSGSSQLQEARGFVRESQSSYRRAIAQYQDLIKQGVELDQAYFELGLLYYQHAEYESAGRYLSKTPLPQARKYRALAFYKAGDFREARDIFKKINKPDAETMFYHGRACEELNLYDQALDIYKQIERGPFKPVAQGRIQNINRYGEDLSFQSLPADLQGIIRSAPSPEKYPNAGAMILNCDERVHLNPDNTATSFEHIVIKILNERGKQDFAEIKINYDSTYEKIELEYARTIRPDGVVVPVGSRHIRDVSKYLNFPLYSNARVRIISFPEVTEGSIIEYKYKVYRSQLVNEDDFVLTYHLQELEPVIKARFQLLIPSEKNLHYKIINPDYKKFPATLEPRRRLIRINSNAGSMPEGAERCVEYNEYLWEFKDIPAIIPEADMPPISKITSIVMLSTFDSWQGVYDWWWPLARDKIQADQAIREKVSALTRGSKTPLEKARAIYNFCAEDIRYVAVEYGQAGYQPHNAADIFFNKYGDCKDQAILLVTMMRQAGIESYPVLIGTDDYIDLQEDFPSINFNHCIAAVRIEGDLVFLDPTCSTCSFGNLPAGDTQRKVLIFDEMGFQIGQTPVQSVEGNRVSKLVEMDINQDETIDARIEVSTFGQYDAGQRAWLRYSTEDAISENLKQVIQKMAPAASLTGYEIHNLGDLNHNLVLKYAFSGGEYWIKAGDLRIFPQFSLMDTSIVAKQQRRYPLDLGFPAVREDQIEIALPLRCALEYLPDTVIKSSPWLDISVGYELEGRHLRFKQVSRIKKRYVSLREYSEFKKFLEEASAQIRKRTIFKYD